MKPTIERRNFIKSTLSLGTLLLMPNFVNKAFARDLPTVFIIGDSISLGYTPFVKAKLSGKAAVSRPDTNCGSTLRGIENLDAWLGDKKYDIIYFNFGLHDLRRVDAVTRKDTKGVETDPTWNTPEGYAANLNTIIKKLKTAGKTLIFATTTPVHPSSHSDPSQVQDRPKKFNEIAKEVMKKNNIIVDDLFAFALPQLSEIQLATNLHYQKKGYEVLGGHVAETISKYL
jgi:hypothetical protein